ncbi:MAG TPA: hypothetical protein VMX96_00585 [Dehalococcoidia bacterium]|nr:hypothetical protein [Dehalococcoidia bacterium]
MKIAATTVGTQGPETPAENQQRLEAAKQALIAAKELGADVLVLPGGFFTCDDSQSRQRIANSLINEAERLSIAVVFGVDEENKDSTQHRSKTKVKVQKQATVWWPDPMYGYAWGPTEEMIHYGRQRSTDSDNQWLVDNRRCKEVRLLMIGDEALGVLICGEIFNQRIRDALRECKSRSNVVADLGHRGAGFRVHHGMKGLGEGEHGIASMCSLHVQGPDAKFRYYIPHKGYMSTECSNKVLEGTPRIKIKILDFSLQNPAACSNLTTSLAVPPP